MESLFLVVCRLSPTTLQVLFRLGSWDMPWQGVWQAVFVWKGVVTRQMDPDSFLGCLDHLMPCLWSLIVSEIIPMMISSRAGYAVTLSLPHCIISHLPSLSLLLLFAGQVHFMKNIVFYRNVCKSWEKNISVCKRGN